MPLVTEITGYYIDYPGIEALDTRTVGGRVLPDYESALDEAIEVYGDNRDLPLIVVCAFPSLRRVATVSGDHRNPRVIRREG